MLDNLWIEWDDTRRVPLFECMEEMGMEITQPKDPDQWVPKIGFISQAMSQKDRVGCVSSIAFRKTRSTP